MIETALRCRTQRMVVAATLVLLACLGSWGCAQTDGRSAAETPAPMVEYMTSTVAPCENRLGGWVDPCAPVEIADRSTDDVMVDIFADPMEIEDVIANSLLASSESFTTHVLMRGVWIPDTVRCELYPYVIGYKSSSKRRDGAYETKCFRDFAVSGYIIGEGPERVTLIWGGTSHYPSNFSSRGELEDLSRKSAGKTIQSAKAEHPREWILTLTPTFANVAHSSWMGNYSFYVERDARGEPKVASTWLDYYRVERREITQQHLDQFTWTLEEFERRAAEFHENRPTMEGPEWDSNHRIVTDIFDIHRFHAEDLKRYHEGTDAIPALPPPAPGKLHSYPPVVTVEP